MADGAPGTMQHWPLVVTDLVEYAARWHGEQEVVSKSVEGSTTITTYRDLRDRARLCALALRDLGVGMGDVIATLAWNTSRHMEAWYGIMGLGAVCHTLNPRLAARDIGWIADHAGDAWVLADAPFLPLLEQIAPMCPKLKGVILLTDRQHMPRGVAGQLPVLCYEQLLDAQVDRLPSFQWPKVEEDAPCGLCYTSGTTGNPKGVMYTHRSNLLHAMVAALPDALALGSASTMLMVVPQFHANSWGIAFAAPMVGARLVLPGPHLDGESIYHMIESHGVTISAGVPTVWANLLAHVEAHGLRFSRLRTIVIGGAAAPRTQVAAFEDRGITVRHMWGMTEISPLGSLGSPKHCQLDGGLGEAELRDLKLSQGRPHVFCDMRIVDGAGRELPHDGKAVGHLQVRGPIVVERYHRAAAPATDAAGRWFDTGDVASIDHLGFMRITDRSKDVIKSGGEWISSIALENAALGHPQVQEAAVVGVPDPKWDERPLLVVVPKPAASPGDAGLEADILAFMAAHPDVAKFAVPDGVLFVEAIPYGATGKISKVALRQMVAQIRGEAQRQPQLARSKL